VASRQHVDLPARPTSQGFTLRSPSFDAFGLFQIPGASLMNALSSVIHENCARDLWLGKSRSAKRSDSPQIDLVCTGDEWVRQKSSANGRSLCSHFVSRHKHGVHDPNIRPLPRHLRECGLHDPLGRLQAQISSRAQSCIHSGCGRMHHHTQVLA